MRTLTILAIRAYQVVLSPLIGNCCRYTPSCSEYCIEAVRRHGCLVGLWLGGKRLCRCHPWHAGGEDPVPRPRETSREGPRRRLHEQIR